MTLYDQLSKGHLNVIGVLEFDPINFSFVLKNKG